MLLEVLYRIHADPIEHIGRRSIDRLWAFETGVILSHPMHVMDYPFAQTFREWLILLYKPSFNTFSIGAYSILQRLIPDEERAFDLFFEHLNSALAAHLNSALAAHPEVLLNPVPLNSQDQEDGPPLPVSGFLNVLTERPMFFLPRLSPGCLRAFLDGVRLARVEAGHFECADLDGFDHWVRRKLDLKGLFRWENAALANFNGAEKESFDWSLQELKAFRTSLGPPNERNYEVVRYRSEDGEAAGSPAQSISD